MRGVKPILGLVMALVLMPAFVTAQTQSGNDKPEKKPLPHNVGIFIFNGVQIIDYTGPYEVFGHAPWDLNIFTVAETANPVTTWMGMSVVPKYTFENAPKADILLVPGGDIRQQIKNPKVIKWIQDRAGEADYVMSVCNGAFFLSKAGLLDGNTATTFYDLIDELKKDAPKARIVRDQRFTDNGKIITTAGLSSGIDGALHLIERIAGRGEAQALALNMEYNWQPESSYARASFADRHLRRMIGRHDDFKLPEGTQLKILGQSGDREAWEKNWTVLGDLSIQELDKLIDTRLSEGWTKQSTGHDSGMVKTLWKFKDEEGKLWSAVSNIQPIPGEKNTYKLTIKIARGDGASAKL
jgi:putative intracellular protease/amidase